MKFTVELDDFWLDEDDDISDSLRTYISHDVVTKISLSIKSKVEKQITEKVNETITKKLDFIINDILSSLVSSETIIYSGKEVLITDHVKNIFQKNNGWSNPTRQIENITSKFTKELKVQYNNAFANSLVKSMKEQGFLKDDIVKILLDGTTNKQIEG